MYKQKSGAMMRAGYDKDVKSPFKKTYPPIGEKQEWEEDVINKKTGEVNRLTNVEKASVLVPAAAGRGAGTKSTEAAQRKVATTLSYAKKGEPLVDIKFTATPEEFAKGGQAVKVEGGEYLTKERKKQAAKIKKAGSTARRALNIRG
jgi:hypothetical protein